MGWAKRPSAVDPGAGVISLVFRAETLPCALRLGEVIDTMRPLAVRALAGTPLLVRGVTIMSGFPAPMSWPAVSRSGPGGGRSGGLAGAGSRHAGAGFPRARRARTRPVVRDRGRGP